MRTPEDDLIMKEAAKIRIPLGPEPTHKKLIELLRKTDEELNLEEQKRKRNYPLFLGLGKKKELGTASVRPVKTSYP